MTTDQLNAIKALIIYAREDCRHDANCSNAVKCMPELVTEIERLKKLVKSAHREGSKVGNAWSGSRDFDDTNTLRLMWHHSEARKALEQE